MNRRATYQQFCDQHHHLPVFVQPWYLDAAPGGPTGWDVALLTDPQGQTLAALPYCHQRRWGLHYADMPLFVKHLGPYLADEHAPLATQHQYYGQLIEALPPLHGFRQAFSPEATNWLPFYWHGYRQTTAYTYRLDLANWPAVETGLNRNMRRNLLKADAQLSLRHHLPLAELHRLIGLSFGRQGQGLPYTWPQLQQHYAALESHQSAALFFAEDPSGRIHSAACLIWDRRRAYYHLSGDDPHLRNSGAGIWLTWQAIRYTHEVLGLPCFDFEGSMLPAIEAIRRQFGARQTPYHVVWKSPLKWLGWWKGWNR